MSSDALPISPARFAEALKDLELPSLHLKVLELRNSIAHLDYSNEQLRPFAEGTEAVLGSEASQPDPDCAEAIRENEQVIERMQDRIRMIRAEVESRGYSWSEFRSKEEVETDQAAAAATNGETTNGVHEEGDASVSAAAASAAAAAATAPTEGTQGRTFDAWTDGTFQTGTIRNGEVHMDETPGAAASADASSGSAAGGRLTDEQLRRAIEERMRDVHFDDDEEEGLHL